MEEAFKLCLKRGKPFAILLGGFEDPELGYESFSTIFTPTETALYPTWVIEDLKSNLSVIIS